MGGLSTTTARCCLLLAMLLLCRHGRAQQAADTFYIVSDYGYTDQLPSGHFPMLVMLPDSQRVTLFAKSLGAKPGKTSSEKLHCLRVIKPKDRPIQLRILYRDSVKRYGVRLFAGDTVLNIGVILPGRDVFMPHFLFRRSFSRPDALIITNEPQHLVFLPLQPGRRKKFLRRFLQGIQYEYHAATGRLIKLYE